MLVPNEDMPPSNDKAHQDYKTGQWHGNAKKMTSQYAIKSK
jgi:hypothetical protein